MPRFPYNPFNSDTGFGKKFAEWLEAFRTNVGLDINEQKSRIDVQLNEVEQPSEILDMRVDEEGEIHAVARDRLISDFHKLDNKIFTLSDDVNTKFINVLSNLDDRGISIKKFNVVGDGSDETAAIDAAIDWAHIQNRKVKFIFPRGRYKYSGSRVIDATKVCFQAVGSVTFDVTGSVNVNSPFVFNFQNSLIEANEVNWGQFVFDGFDFRTTLSEDVLKQKDTVLFVFETPHQFGSLGDNTKKSSNMTFNNITGRYLPFFTTFGHSAYLIKFINTNVRLCRSHIKIFNPNEPGIINKTTSPNGRYHNDYGENIAFTGGQIGGAWETVIYNKLPLGSLNFSHMSIDYWYGGTFFVGGHNGSTKFSLCHIEAAHSPSSENNSYNKNNSSKKWWIEVDGSHKLDFLETLFYSGPFANRDTTDLESLVKSFSANTQVNFDHCEIMNMKFTKRELFSGPGEYHIGNNCKFLDSIPFFKNRSEGNDNLIFRQRYEDIHSIVELENVSAFYKSAAPKENLTNQWTNTTVKVEWDNTVKAFRLTRLSGDLAPSVYFSFPAGDRSGSYGSLMTTFDIRADGIVNGKIIVKLRGGKLMEKAFITNEVFTKFYEHDDSYTEFIRNLFPLSTVPTTFTTYTQTAANDFIRKVPRINNYIIEFDLSSLNVGESVYVRDIVAQIL